MLTMTDTLYRHSTGEIIEVSTGIDLTTATLVEFVVKKPSNKVVNWVATKQSGTGGIAVYTTITGDINEDGMYYLQAKVTFPNRTAYGKSTKFKVLDTFEVD